MENDNVKSWKLTLAIMTASALLMSASYTMLIPFLPMYLIQELNVAQEDVNLWSGVIFSISFAISGIMAPIWGGDGRQEEPQAHGRARGGVPRDRLRPGRHGAGRLAALLGARFPGLRFGALARLPRDSDGERAESEARVLSGPHAGRFHGGRRSRAAPGRHARRSLRHGAAFYLGGVGLFIITLLIVFYIKEPPRKKVEKVESNRPKTNLLKVPVVQRMLLCAGVVQLTILLQQPIMPLYVGELQGSMDRIVLVTGMLFSVVGISGIIAAPVWGVVGQKWGFRPALYLALLGSGVFGMIQAIPTTLIPFGVWRFIGGLAFAGIFPAINAVLSQSSAPEDRGRIFGLSYAAQQIGSVLGPIAGGAMAMFLPLKAVIFTGGFVLIPLVAFLYLMRPKVEPNTKGDPANLH